jgi:hypothetical protein
VVRSCVFSCYISRTRGSHGGFVVKPWIIRDRFMFRIIGSSSGLVVQSWFISGSFSELVVQIAD